MGQYLIAMIVGIRLLGDSLFDSLDNFLSGGSQGIGGGAASGIASLDGLFDSGLSLFGGLLGVVVATGSSANHHGDDSGGHKYLFHGQ